jgi:lysophospholipase L1-like esterase
MQQRSFKFIIMVLSIFMGASVLYAAPVRIMPLGDSITEGYIENLDSSNFYGYRAPLWYMLQDADYEADFTGSQIAGEAVEPAFDADHEGHFGWTSYALDDLAYASLVQYGAEIVLLHIGTNDIGDSTAGVSQVLDQIDRYEKESGHTVKVFVAMIIEQADYDVRQFNENLAATIGARIRYGDNLTLVNMYTGAGLTIDDYSDRIHPNGNGYSKMAAVWFNAIMAPDTPGLYAFPYMLVSKEYIDAGSIVVNSSTQSVEFVTEVPDNGIIF